MTKSSPLPSHIAPSGALDRLAETARDYACQGSFMGGLALNQPSR